MGRLKDHFFDEINSDDDGYDKYLADIEIARAEAEIEKARAEAEKYIQNKYKECIDSGRYRNVWNTFEFHSAIWYASTEILPKLEIQVLIDAENNCFVTTGSAGYVEFGIRELPLGLKIPIKCWIHTHPFGLAYFSDVDIRTINAMNHYIQNAIVLGGYNHWGSWTNNSLNELTIYVNGKEDRIQKWGSEEE